MNRTATHNNIWFISFKPDTEVMLYQPIDKPLSELLIITNIMKKHLINKAYYTRISINAENVINDYHLIGLVINVNFEISKFEMDLDKHIEQIKNFKFILVDDSNEASSQIKTLAPFYKK